MKKCQCGCANQLFFFNQSDVMRAVMRTENDSDCHIFMPLYNSNSSIILWSKFETTCQRVKIIHNLNNEQSSCYSFLRNIVFYLWKPNTENILAKVYQKHLFSTIFNSRNIFQKCFFLNADAPYNMYLYCFTAHHKLALWFGLVFNRLIFIFFLVFRSGLVTSMQITTLHCKTYYVSYPHNFL